MHSYEANGVRSDPLHSISTEMLCPAGGAGMGSRNRGHIESIEL